MLTVNSKIMTQSLRSMVTTELELFFLSHKALGVGTKDNLTAFCVRFQSNRIILN